MNTISITTDISWEVRRRFLPGLKAWGLHAAMLMTANIKLRSAEWFGAEQA